MWSDSAKTGSDLFVLQKAQAWRFHNVKLDSDTSSHGRMTVMNSPGRSGTKCCDSVVNAGAGVARSAAERRTGPCMNS